MWRDKKRSVTRLSETQAEHTDALSFKNVTRSLDLSRSDYKPSKHALLEIGKRSYHNQQSNRIGKRSN